MVWVDGVDGSLGERHAMVHAGGLAAAALARAAVALEHAGPGWFENEYGLTSADFLRRYREADEVAGVPRFHAHVWASMLRDMERMSAADGADPFVEHTERMLAGTTTK